MIPMSRRPDSGILRAISAFAAHRWGRFRDDGAIARHQAHSWARMRHDILPHAPFYAGLNPADPHDLAAMDRARMMAEFDGLTTTGLTLSEVQTLARAVEPGAPPSNPRPDGLAAGFSTGTSGQRGLFLTAPAERRLWAAALAGRFLPRPALRLPQRIALFLRADNRLYDALNKGPLRLRFFDAGLPPEAHLGDLLRFRPTVLAGPPSVLTSVAHAIERAGETLRIGTVLCGAEPAEPQDLDALERAFGPRPDIIYQCTEGVLAMTCRHGRLHLNERHISFRRELIDPESGAFVPIISDLSRQSLMLLNYRLDDVLVPDFAPCPCGCASARIRRIEGRLSDAIFLPSGQGPRWISAADLRNLALAEPGVADWALVQTARDRLRFHLPGCQPEHARQRLTLACAALALSRNCDPPKIEIATELPPPDGIKRRRVRGFAA